MPKSIRKIERGKTDKERMGGGGKTTRRQPMLLDSGETYTHLRSPGV